MLESLARLRRIDVPTAWRGLGAATLVLAPLVLGALSAPGCGARSPLDVPDVPGSTTCADFQASADLAPLDVFIMMDSSRSMTFTTSDGTTKWSAIQEALGAFLSDPQSAGIGATIAFFPIVDPGVPETCASDMDCGKPGACTLVNICFPSGATTCDTDADCAGTPGDACIPLGQCSLDNNQACLPDGQIACPAGAGSCLPYGFCDNHDTCDEGQYAAAAPPIALLPGAASGITSSIAAVMPDGATPTLPALSGAVSRASDWANAHPSHKAIVVLATDGLPTTCDPAITTKDPTSGTPAVVQAAATGLTRGIQTFLIGVFAPDEKDAAQPNLDAIAKAGGTDKAFVISTGDPVAKLLVDALDQVRKSAKACEFAIPASGGTPLDLTHLWVRVTPVKGSPVDVKRVSSAATCDPKGGGFFFDGSIGGSPPPSRIILCPTTCQLLAGATNRSIEVLVSCSQ